MKNIKRVLSVVMMLAMLVPLTAVGSYADVAVEDNWYTLASKYSSSTDKIIAPSNEIKTVGFDFTVTEDGGIHATVPGQDVFKGICPVAAISSKNGIFLDGLKVNIDPFSDTNDGKISPRFSVVWSDVEITNVCDPVTESGLYYGNAVSTNSLRHIVEGLSASGLCVSVSTTVLIPEPVFPSFFTPAILLMPATAVPATDGSSPRVITPILPMATLLPSAAVTKRSILPTVSRFTFVPTLPLALSLR